MKFIIDIFTDAFSNGYDSSDEDDDEDDDDSDDQDFVGAFADYYKSKQDFRKNKTGKKKKFTLKMYSEIILSQRKKRHLTFLRVATAQGKQGI